MNRFTFIILTFFSFLISCKNKTPEPATQGQTSSTQTTTTKIVYGGQKDGQYLTKIIGEDRKYDFLKKDSIILTYNTQKQITNITNFMLQAGYNATNGFIKKYESTFEYNSQGNMINCTINDLPNKYSYQCGFSYDDTNKLIRISNKIQTNSYTEYANRITESSSGFILTNNLIDLEHTIDTDGNLTKFSNGGTMSIVFENQGFKTTVVSPFFGLPTNMQKVFYSTNLSPYLFLTTFEELDCISKNVPTKIVSSGSMYITNDIVAKTDSKGYVTDLSVNNSFTSSTYFKKFRFSYNDK